MERFGHPSWKTGFKFYLQLSDFVLTKGSGETAETDVFSFGMAEVGE